MLWIQTQVEDLFSGDQLFNSDYCPTFLLRKVDDLFFGNQLCQKLFAYPQEFLWGFMDPCLQITGLGICERQFYTTWNT